MNLSLALSGILASANLLSYLFRKKKDDNEPSQEIRDEIAQGDQRIGEIMEQVERLNGVLQLLQRRAEESPNDPSIQPGIQAILHEQELAIQQLEAEQESQDKRVVALAEGPNQQRDTQSAGTQYLNQPASQAAPATHYSPAAAPAKPVTQLDGLQQAIDSSKQKFDALRAQLGTAVGDQFKDVDQFVQAYNKAWIEAMIELDKYCDGLNNLREPIERVWATHEAVALSMTVSGYPAEAVEAGAEALQDLKGDIPVPESLLADAGDVSIDGALAEPFIETELGHAEPQATATESEHGDPSALLEAEAAIDLAATALLEEPQAGLESQGEISIEIESALQSPEVVEADASSQSDEAVGFSGQALEESPETEAFLQTEDSVAVLESEDGEGAQAEAVIQDEQAGSDIPLEATAQIEDAEATEEFNLTADEFVGPEAILEQAIEVPVEPEATLELDAPADLQEQVVEDPTTSEAFLQEEGMTGIVEQLTGEPGKSVIEAEGALHEDEPTASAENAIEEVFEFDATLEVDDSNSRADHSEGQFIEAEAVHEIDEASASAAYSVEDSVEAEAILEPDEPTASAEYQPAELNEPEAIHETEEPTASAELSAEVLDTELEAALETNEPTSNAEYLIEEPVSAEANHEALEPVASAEYGSEGVSEPEAALEIEEAAGGVECASNGVYDPEATFEIEGPAAGTDTSADASVEIEAILEIEGQDSTEHSPEGVVEIEAAYEVEEPVPNPEYAISEPIEAEAALETEEPSHEEAIAVAFFADEAEITVAAVEDSLVAQGFEPIEEATIGILPNEEQAPFEQALSDELPAPELHETEPIGVIEPAQLEDPSEGLSELEAIQADAARDQILSQFDMSYAVEQQAAHEPENSAPETSYDASSDVSDESTAPEVSLVASFDEAVAEPEGAPANAMQQAIDRGDVILVDPKSENYNLIKKAAVGGRNSLTDPTVSIERAVERMRELYDVSDSAFRAALERGIERIADPQTADPSAPAEYVPLADDETRSLVRTLIGRAEPGDLDVVRRMISRGSHAA